MTKAMHEQNTGTNMSVEALMVHASESATQKLPLLEVVLYLLGAVAVLFALEGRRDGCPQVVDELLHVAVELKPARGRQPQSPRRVSLREIIDVAPVRGCGRRRRGLFEISSDERVFAEARRAQHEQVIPVATHADAEVHGVKRTLLADHLFQLLQLIGCLERQTVCRAGHVEPCGS